MFCINCGARNKDEARFCITCGKPFKKSENNNENTIKMHYIRDEVEEEQPEIKEVYAERKSSTNGGMISLVIIAIIIALGAGGFIGYKFIIADSKPKVNEKSPSNAPVKEEKKDGETNNSNVTYKEEAGKVDKNSVEYILPESDSKVLSSAELSNLSKEDLAYARNEIYARHGYIFNSQAYRDYFSSKAWYRENPSFNGNESELNSFEKANVKLIKSLEGN